MSRNPPGAMPRAICPCGSGKPYAACCEPIHLGLEPAATAEALMRSRYSAYVLGLEAYLRASWHVSTRPERVLHEDHASVKWLGLDVLRSGARGADTAFVEFVARSRVGGGRAERQHEISRFLREDGRWYYVDGEFPKR